MQACSETQTGRLSGLRVAACVSHLIAGVVVALAAFAALAASALSMG